MYDYQQILTEVFKVMPHELDAFKVDLLDSWNFDYDSETMYHNFSELSDLHEFLEGIKSSKMQTIAIRVDDSEDVDEVLKTFKFCVNR